jgi:hypothetical protein
MPILSASCADGPPDICISPVPVCRLLLHWLKRCGLRHHLKPRHIVTWPRALSSFKLVVFVGAQPHCNDWHANRAPEALGSSVQIEKRAKSCGNAYHALNVILQSASEMPAARKASWARPRLSAGMRRTCKSNCTPTGRLSPNCRHSRGGKTP